MHLYFPSVRGARLRASGVALSLAVGLAATLVSAPISAADGLPPAPGTTAVPGATIIGEQWLTERTLELTVDSPSFTAPAKVEVMLPTGYAADPTRSWPATYFLNGTDHDQSLFRTSYNGEALTSSYDSIVISPSGNSGYWSDWYNNGAGGPPMYETFVTQQLIPLIDTNFRTLKDRAHRAILGDSMGGYGTLMLAARHPDLFVAASSLSGAVDTNWVPGAAVATASPALDTAIPDSIYGPRATNEVNWRGHNPVDLAENLGSVDVQLYTGNGILGTNEISQPTAPAFTTFGWSVTADPNRAAEFLDLHDVSSTGFTITGSGTTQVTTPPIFRGNKPLTVLINGTPTTLSPDSAGRITVSVDLGQHDPAQQYTLGATTNLRTSVISFLSK